MTNRPSPGANSCRPMTTGQSFKRPIDFSAHDRYPQPLNGVGRKPPKPRERPTGTRSAPTREKRHRSGCGVLANRLRTAETTDRAAHESAVSRTTVSEVPLTGLSLSRASGRDTVPPARGGHDPGASHTRAARSGAAAAARPRARPPARARQSVLRRCKAARAWPALAARSGW